MTTRTAGTTRQRASADRSDHRRLQESRSGRRVVRRHPTHRGAHHEPPRHTQRLLNHRPTLSARPPTRGRSARQQGYRRPLQPQPDRPARLISGGLQALKHHRCRPCGTHPSYGGCSTNLPWRICAGVPAARGWSGTMCSASWSSGACPRDEAGGQFYSDLGRLLSSANGERHFGGCCRHFGQGLVHGGQRWIDPGRDGEVIEADDADVFGYAQSGFAGGLVGADRLQVVAGEDRCGVRLADQHRVRPR